MNDSRHLFYREFDEYTLAYIIHRGVENKTEIWNNWNSICRSVHLDRAEKPFVLHTGGEKFAH